nr:MAG TPA: hypothetical protein [Caudoviricetes sp.]
MDYLTNDTDLKKVADAIRSKAGVTDSLVFPDGFVSSISGIIMPTYTLVVKTSPSSSITVTKGTKTFSGTADASGECTFSLPEAGVWTVTVGTKMETVIIGTQELEVTLFDPVFANNSWAQIIAACHNGTVPDTWTAENQKAMTINGAEYAIDIIGKAHDDYADGSGKAPLTFGMHDCYGTAYAMNGLNSNSSGWKDSVMRTTYLPAILALMPKEVQNGIREVSKKASAGGQSTTIVTVSDKLFLLSEIEIFGSTRYSAAGEGTQYDYYKAGNSKVKNRSGSAAVWWDRSPYVNGSGAFCVVYSNGTANYDAAGYDRGVSFGFCF